jgi:protein-tyrosine-phosphatase
MKNEELKKLEDKVVSQAIALINTDEMAAKLAKSLQKEIEDNFKEHLIDFDLGYWLRSEIEDPSTATGKAFEKAMSKIVKKMVTAI